MSQCVDGIKHLCTSVLGCFDLDLYKQSGGLGDPELLARDTVCMPYHLLYSFFFFFFPVIRFDAIPFEECKNISSEDY